MYRKGSVLTGLGPGIALNPVPWIFLDANLQRLAKLHRWTSAESDNFRERKASLKVIHTSMSVAIVTYMSDGYEEIATMLIYMHLYIQALFPFRILLICAPVSEYAVCAAYTYRRPQRHKHNSIVSELQNGIMGQLAVVVFSCECPQSTLEKHWWKPKYRGRPEIRR